MHRHDAPDRAGVHVAQPADQYLADAHAGTRLRIELDLGFQDSRFRIEVPQHFGVGIAVVPQPPDDRVGGRLHHEAVEWIAHLQRQLAYQSRHIENAVQSTHLEPGHPHRLPFVNPERDVHIARRTLHQRVHDGVHIAALAIEQNQTDHVTPEFDFIEIAFLAEAQPPHVPLAGPPARSCRSDRAFERVVVERPVTDERQTPNHPLLFLSGEDGRRYQGGEQQAGYDAQLT